MTAADITPRIDPQSTVKLANNVYARSFGEELVLLDFGRGEYFGLDEVAADVWKGCEGGDSLSAIANAIVQRYEVSYEVALRDIITLITQMRDKGLLTIVASE